MLVSRHHLGAVAAALLAVSAVSPASASSLSGTITSVGSDTLESLMEKWTASFKAAHPGVAFEVESQGSSTAPSALTEGRSHLGPMSRKMKAKEIKAFELAHGYKPTAIRVAIDALAVFVHKDNPIDGLTLAQVDAIFSEGRKCGGDEAVDSWGQLGLDGDLAGARLNAYGRDPASGTRAYFAKKALCKGDFKASVKAISSSSGIVDEIASDPAGIGYSGMGYATDGVRAVPIAKRGGQPFVDATPESASAGKYPLGRFLYVYVNKRPGEPLSEAVSAFVQWILSSKGQAAAADSGFIPLPERTVAKETKVAAR